MHPPIRHFLLHGKLLRWTRQQPGTSTTATHRPMPLHTRSCFLRRCLLFHQSPCSLTWYQSNRESLDDTAPRNKGDYCTSITSADGTSPEWTNGKCTSRRVQVKDWCADLRRLSAGAALVALTLWLDQMQDAALQGFPESPKFVTLVTGCNQSARNKISVEQTVKVHLWSMGSPFLKSESRTGLFEAKGYSLRHWLKDSPHCMDMKLRNFSVLPEMNSMQVHGGAFMPARLVSGLQQIEESIGDLRPKKFHRLIHLTEMKRNQVIFAELKAREEMVRKGRRVNLKGKRKAKLRKRLHRIQPVK